MKAFLFEQRRTSPRRVPTPFWPICDSCTVYKISRLPAYLKQDCLLINGRPHANACICYAWSLPVMPQIWRSHQSIRRSAKTSMLHANATALRFIVRSYGRPKFDIAGIGIFDLFAPVTLTFAQWPSYTHLTIGVARIFAADALCCCLKY